MVLITLDLGQAHVPAPPISEPEFPATRAQEMAPSSPLSCHRAAPFYPSRARVLPGIVHPTLSPARVVRCPPDYPLPHIANR
ncbi:hypothetical protein DL93DRAFT_2164349 [Clavulina sp. PMI_390]|nr:hypothetical protein DL93DRAFT_2164349 [Clavulina sp. PMI_390]